MKLDDFIKEEKKPWEEDGIEWREVKIKDVCKRRSENVIPDGDKDIYVGLEHIQSGEIELKRWDYSGKVKSTKYRFYPNDILYGKLRPYLDKAVVATKEGICSTDFIVIQAIEDKILPYYLVFFLHTKSFVDYTTSMMKGVHLPRVSWSTIKNVKIPLPFRNGKPDLETQRKIVEYIEANFSRIDGIIERKKRELERLDELWESALEQAFRPKAGEEWREVKLKAATEDIKSGGTPSRRKEEYWKNGTIPWVKIQDIPEDGFVSTTEEKITEIGLRNSSAKLLPEGTILFTIFATIGRVGILNIKAATNQAIAGIIPKREYDTKYMYWVLRKFGENLKDRGRGGAQNNVNLTFLRNLKIPVPFRKGKPDLEKQREIAQYLDSVYEKIRMLKEKIHNQISQLEEMKESILEEVFNHQVLTS